VFRSRLDQIIDLDHALAKLARAIDWRFLEEKFGAVWLRIILRLILAALAAPAHGRLKRLRLPHHQ
jgi:hypothetical protein